MTPSVEYRPPFEEIRRKAAEISARIGTPRFYIDMKSELGESERRMALAPEVTLAGEIVRNRGDALGHGFRHAWRVAHEAGAIVYAELGFGERSDRLADAALISGFLHDLRRGEKDHPERAAVEVRDIFKDRLEARTLDMIVFAIRNHEAFRDHEETDDPDFMLSAGALYDADKFRWGPDNFTDTLWNMAESMHADLNAVMTHYEHGVRGINRIRDTFRTQTGRKYGPAFIDDGLAIGEELFRLYRDNLL